MTTTISLATSNCIVLGCDSLGTISNPYVPWISIYQHLFESNGNPKTDANGVPVTLTSEKLFELSQPIPSNQIPSLTKLFPLGKPKEHLPVGLLFAGLASLGAKSLKTIIEEFQESAGFKTAAKKMDSLTKALSEHLDKEYKASSQYYSPMEVIVSGYSKGSHDPEIWKIVIKYGDEPEITECNEDPSRYSIVFGGQHDVIQRVVNGIDDRGWGVAIHQAYFALGLYQERLKNYLQGNGYTGDVPDFNTLVPKSEERFDFPFAYSRLSSELRFFSEQAAIEFVEFLVDLMIKSQQFSDRLPTVGGEIHIGLITPSDGFRWMSEEAYKTRFHAVSKHKE